MKSKIDNKVKGKDTEQLNEELNEHIENEEEMKEQIEEYEKIYKSDRRQKIILVIIIIILLLLLWFIWFFGFRLGKIGYQEVSTTPTEDGYNIKLIEVRDEDIEITKNTELNIFENEKYNNQKIIAPKSSGTYQFCIKNIANRDITYDINFTDLMDLPVNMKYKLKIDNIYIRGNEASYINIEELSVKDVIVVKDSINLFTLEWYWEDDDINDTIVGSQKDDQYYTLNLEIGAREYKKQR